VQSVVMASALPVSRTTVPALLSVPERLWLNDEPDEAVEKTA